MTNSVKFLKGTPTAFAALENKDPNTLYFIIAENANVGKLYLGDVLVAGNVTEDGTEIVDALGELLDVELQDVQPGQVLGYNGSVWVPMDHPEMEGATSEQDGVAGCVPAPQAGE